MGTSIRSLVLPHTYPQTGKPKPDAIPTSISTNWRDDYHLKFADYEEMGIAEYWIIDYAALGGRNFIGNPKQPTISVCNLVDREYQISKFQNSDRLISQIFPALNLTANQIFTSGLPN